MGKWLALALAGGLAGCCQCPQQPGAATSATSAAAASGTTAADDRPTGDTFMLKPGVWAIFKEYRTKLTPASDEYFASASDGAWAWKETPQQALSLCQDQSTGPKCILFAHNAKILVPYRLQVIE